MFSAGSLVSVEVQRCPLLAPLMAPLLAPLLTLFLAFFLFLCAEYGTYQLLFLRGEHRADPFFERLTQRLHAPLGRGETR